jgi:hypothetical protein
MPVPPLPDALGRERRRSLGARHLAQSGGAREAEQLLPRRCGELWRSGPNQTLGGVRPAAARRSGPGQATTLASLQMIQERCASRPRRALVTAGISIAVVGSAGGL